MSIDEIMFWDKWPQFRCDFLKYSKYFFKIAPRCDAKILAIRSCRFIQSFPNTLIYGHRMRDGSMFGSLKHYEDADFWRENPSVYLSNEAGTWWYDIYAAYEV